VSTQESDERIVTAVLNGDTDAFDILVLKYQRQIGSLVVRMTGYHADVADIVQRIFVKAFTKLRTFQRKAKFLTWLYAIALNTCRNDLRKIIRSRKEEDVEDAGLQIQSKTEETLLQEQRKQQLQKALRLLPQRQFETVTLRIHQELSFKEIAEILETSENTAKVNFHHGMKKLRELVHD
jgi:RNA polymerase sigma-70 factor (ECF subfamily)